MEVTLASRLELALDSGPGGLESLAGAAPAHWRDCLTTLAIIHDLHMAPLSELGRRARWQHHPAVAALKQQLEESLIETLERRCGAGAGHASTDPAAAIRRLARPSAVPGIYAWLEAEASAREVSWFVSLEGGPDGGFDDLVALCQIGLAGEPKLEMARNYWDEMGRGRQRKVHTELHRQMSRTLGIVPPQRSELPVGALERAVLGTTLASNRWLQPELVGALAVIELQAGQRCRRVVAALHRVGAPAGARAFYEEHAAADPRHGKDWLDNVVVPLGHDPSWARGMLRGALWRLCVNDRFLACLAARARACPANATAA